MRIFANCLEAMSEVHRDLFEMGIRVTPKTMQDKVIEGNKDFETIELQGYNFRILDTSDMDAMVEARGLNLQWCYDDLHERLSPSEINPGEAYKLREEWAEFVHEGKFAYTYNERIRTQLDKTIEILDNDKETRQAVITIYEGAKDSDNRLGKKRVPCSMYYQAIIRDGKLDLIYTMRSSDFMTHWPYDIWMAASLKNHIASHIGVEAGSLVYFAGSLHAYAKDVPETF